MFDPFRKTDASVHLAPGLLLPRH